MKFTSILSKVVIKEVSQKLAKKLVDKFKEQTKDNEETIMSMINKFDGYKEGLDVSKRDITKYNYNDLKSLIIGKELEKSASNAFTKLKQKWDKLRQELPSEESGPYRYESSVLKSLVSKFYDIYPFLKKSEKDIMNYDYLSLTNFIQQNYGKIILKNISDLLSKDSDVPNPETLLFYLESFIRNRDRVPRGTKPIFMMSFHDLEHLVDGSLSQNDKDAEKQKTDYSDIDVVYDKDNLLVFAPKSKDQCVRLKNGRSWCTSREGSSNLYYNYRLNNERTLYYVIDQDKSFGDLNYAVVLLVDPQGRISLADGSNSGRYSGHQNIPWKEIEDKIPKLKGLENVFQPKPLTDEERNLIQKVRGVRVGDNPFDSLGDEKTVEMWMEYNSPKLTDNQYSNLTPDLQKKYVALGFDLTADQLKSSSEQVIKYYINKKKEKLATTTLDRLSKEDIDLLLTPMMKKFKDSLRERFATSLSSSNQDTSLSFKLGEGSLGKFTALYGLDSFFDSLPENITELVIDGYGNIMITIPDSIAKFRNMEMIGFNNCVDKIPDTICQLTKLNYLGLMNNSNLTELPPCIADLPNFWFLNVRGCDKLELPEAIKNKGIDMGRGQWQFDDL